MNDTVQPNFKYMQSKIEGLQERLSVALWTIEAQDKLIADLDLVAKAAGISVVEFMRERDALKAELAVMRAQKPVAYITDTEQGPMVWTPEMYGEACTYCDDGEFPEPLCKVMP